MDTSMATLSMLSCLTFVTFTALAIIYTVKEFVREPTQSTIPLGLDAGHRPRILAMLLPLTFSGQLFFWTMGWVTLAKIATVGYLPLVVAVGVLIKQWFDLGAGR
jgi:hypothetical protein